MTNWEEYIAAPGNLFRPELNHVYAEQRTYLYWFTLTELLTGGEKKNVPGVKKIKEKTPSRNSISLSLYIYIYIFARPIWHPYTAVLKVLG